MSINMFLPEVQQQTDSVVKMCRTYITGMEEVKRNIASFSIEYRLKGRTYDSAKRYFRSAYLPLADGIILLSEKIILAHQQFPEQYIAHVDSNSLQSDALEAQIQKIEISIQSLKRLQKIPFMAMPTTTALMSMKFLQAQIKEKLNRLIAFHGISPQIFSDIDGIVADVKLGLAEVSSGRAWNSKSGSFDPNRLNMAWAENIKDKKFEFAVDELMAKLESLDEETREEILRIAQEDPDSLLDYLKENVDTVDTVVELTVGSMAEIIQAAGEDPARMSALIQRIGATKGPAGPNSFVMPNKHTRGISRFIHNNAGVLARHGKGLGTITGGAGFGLGMYDDVVNEEKSLGEAVAINTASLGVGSAGAWAGGSAGAIAAGAAGVSNPVGWIVGGTIIGGYALTKGFEFLYDNNKWVRDSLEVVGEAIQENIIENPIIIGVFPFTWTR